ncbi:hypothetical protein [Phaeocystidibacter marisrubri]|uniref:DUF3108 domain-containing protein n=1 Tax=Phaeocystidibacter marisrubri TaxID=1577780 RepID=A0A6L3ZE05_9FLAO|nr:hypothetical protein [Phaeocystidibacter marisrubri]KAB2815674.1 hypothetical protein F8C82_08195 [Phaeocystidibacter marisrubri]GGH65118.1 hypothetical protein GCM10011318_01800 [Phaeocystidibacter marisrubri]
MKYAAFLLPLLALACTRIPSNATKIEAESAHYKMFIEDNGVLSQTPIEVFIHIVPTDDGFLRTQSMVAEGLHFEDTLKLDHWGRPLKHVNHQGSKKTQIEYSRESASVSQGGDFIPYPILPGTIDAIQLDLLLSKIDTIKDTIDLPIFNSTSGDIVFYQVSEIKKDSLNSHFTSFEKIPVAHRFAVAPGHIYEAWYNEKFILPIKTRVTSAGSTYVYWKLGKEPVRWQ